MWGLGVGGWGLEESRVEYLFVSRARGRVYHGIEICRSRYIYDLLRSILISL